MKMNPVEIVKENLANYRKKNINYQIDEDFIIDNLEEENEDNIIMRLVLLSIKEGPNRSVKRVHEMVYWRSRFDYGQWNHEWTFSDHLIDNLKKAGLVTTLHNQTRLTNLGQEFVRHYNI